MTNKKFLKAKNKIVKRVTGKTLIPKDQIVKEPFIELDPTFESCGDLDANICTYCKNRHMNSQLYTEDEHMCNSCPMSKAGNKCERDQGTWGEAQQEWVEKATKEDIMELMFLCKKYNEENDHRR